MKINTTLINKRNSEIERTIKRGMTIENFEESEGITPEEAVLEARELLGLKDDELIIINYEDILKRNFKKLDAFRNVVNLLNSLQDASNDEKITLQNIKNRLELYISEKLEIDIEDLYEEGE